MGEGKDFTSAFAKFSQNTPTKYSQYIHNTHDAFTTYSKSRHNIFTNCSQSIRKTFAKCPQAPTLYSLSVHKHPSMQFPNPSKSPAGQNTEQKKNNDEKQKNINFNPRLRPCFENNQNLNYAASLLFPSKQRRKPLTPTLTAPQGNAHFQVLCRSHKTHTTLSTQRSGTTTD